MNLLKTHCAPGLSWGHLTTLASAVHPHRRAGVPQPQITAPSGSPSPADAFCLSVFSHPPYLCALYSTRRPFPFGRRNSYSCVNALAPLASSCPGSCPHAPAAARQPGRKPSARCRLRHRGLSFQISGPGGPTQRFPVSHCGPGRGGELTPGPGRKPMPLAASVSPNSEGTGVPFPSRPAGTLGGCVGRGGPRWPRGLRKPRPQEFGASTPYKDICSASQWAAGAAPGPVPGRPPAHPSRAGPRSARPSAPRRSPVPAMSSTQFNKGPSYGLSAEVRNRVSGRGARPRTRRRAAPRP